MCLSDFRPQIDVGSETEIPSIITPGSKNFTIGSQAHVFKDYNITFYCNVVNGTPLIAILWLRNNVEIFSSEKNSSTITITDAKDGENITCRADNCIGFDVASSMILVKGEYNYEIVIIIIIQIVEIDLNYLVILTLP